MTELDITFDDGKVEALLQTIDGVLTVPQLLTVLEGESQEFLEGMLLQINQKQMTLTLGDLSSVPVDADSMLRMKLECDLVAQNVLPHGLPETDPLRLYMEELAGIPVCGDPALLASALREGDSSAGEKLAALMLGRVVQIAQEYVGKGLLLLDLIQEGSLGLWEGLQAYEGQEIESYCQWWIRQYMHYGILRQARDAGVGQKLKQALSDYRSIDEQLLAQLGRNPTAEELAEALHLTLEETQIVAKMLDNVRSLNRAKQPEPEALPQEEDQAVEDTAYFQMRQRVSELLSGLSEEDAKLLRLRYGLDGGLPMDPQQVGLKLGITAQEVINREAAALAKLRQ